MKIDAMTAEDLPTILNLADQLGYPGSLEDFKSRFSEIEKNSNFALFVARAESGKPIGYIQINREAHTLLAGPRAEVAALIVDQAERSQGVGAALLKHAEDWAREKKLPLIRIRSNVKRSDAHRFYQKNGYEIAKSAHLLTKAMD